MASRRHHQIATTADRWVLALALATSVAGCAEPALEVGPGEVEPVDGKADAAGTGQVELKLTIDAAHIGRARTRLRLKDAASQRRSIWFYDTPELALFDAGMIVRARKIADAPDDSTVKLRPMTLAELEPSLRGLPGSKCEIDRLVDREASSCSFSAVQDTGEIDAVAAGTRAIDKLFSAAQEDVYALHGPAIGWDELVPLGPIPARVWTVRSAELPTKASAELWTLADGSEVLELSIKVAPADADDALAELVAFAATRGLGLSQEQETKTRRALSLLAAQD